MREPNSRNGVVVALVPREARVVSTTRRSQALERFGPRFAVVVEQRFVRGAMRAFARDGFRSTTMADIDEAVGVSEPGAHEVFDSLLDAYRAAAEMATGMLVDEVRTRVGRFTPSGFAQAVEKLRCDRPDATKVVVQSLTSATADDRLAPIANTTLRRLTAVLLGEVRATPAQTRAALADLVMTELVASWGVDEPTIGLRGPTSATS